MEGVARFSLAQARSSSSCADTDSVMVVTTRTGFITHATANMSRLPTPNGGSVRVRRCSWFQACNTTHLRVLHPQAKKKKKKESHRREGCHSRTHFCPRSHFELKINLAKKGLPQPQSQHFQLTASARVDATGRLPLCVTRGPWKKLWTHSPFHIVATLPSCFQHRRRHRQAHRSITWIREKWSIQMMLCAKGRMQK